ncbi:MAG: hypothetical protein ACE5GX_12245 [Thermoanaerobaculia bacterium]
MRTKSRCAGGTATVGMHGDDLSYAIRGILYSSRQTARLPGLIQRAARTGNG